jgi:hypothetical protein
MSPRVAAVDCLGPQLSARERRGHQVVYQRDGCIVLHHAGPVGNASSKEAVG